MTKYRIVAEFETESGHQAWVARNDVEMVLRDIAQASKEDETLFAFKLGKVTLSKKSVL
jgi:hypothetical protein